MTVPQETAPSGASSDTASTRLSAADAGLSTDEEHACNLTELADHRYRSCHPGFRACSAAGGANFACATLMPYPRQDHRKAAGWDELTMICVEPGPVGRYCLCRC